MSITLDTLAIEVLEAQKVAELSGGYEIFVVVDENESEGE